MVIWETSLVPEEFKYISNPSLFLECLVRLKVSGLDEEID